MRVVLIGRIRIETDVREPKMLLARKIAPIPDKPTRIAGAQLCS
jgi:hypothetical protein